MSRIATLKSRMQSLGGDAKKSLGQNFLVHESTIHKIVEVVLEINPVAIVEIGPGLGSLTEDLIAEGKELTLVELDSRFAEYWRNRGETVIEADALDLQWSELQLPKGTALVGNLPYQISSRLVIEVSVQAQSITNMVLMFQKEVAERITAKPKTKNYGLLSVLAQSFWAATKVADVAPSGFYPPPKIVSRVLHFKRISAPGLDDGFVDFVKRCFTNRRKLMVKNFSGESKWLLTELNHLGYGEKTRAEEISTVDYQALYRRWNLKKS